MKINYDAHTHALAHGDGELPLKIEENILAALDLGFDTLYFTDHVPLPPGFTDPAPQKDCAMSLERYETEYMPKLLEMKQKYADKIRVIVGGEFDYLPKYLDWTKRMQAKFNYEYRLGSVHFYDEISFEGEQLNLPVDFSSYIQIGIEHYGTLERMVKRYYQLCRRLCESGLFDTLAHPDLVKKHTSEFIDETADWYRNEVADTLKAVANAGIILEINTAGLYKECQAIYPSPWIIAEAKKLGIKLIAGSDAHNPEEIGRDFQKVEQYFK